MADTGCRSKDSTLPSPAAILARLLIERLNAQFRILDVEDTHISPLAEMNDVARQVWTGACADVLSINLRLSRDALAAHRALVQAQELLADCRRMLLPSVRDSASDVLGLYDEIDGFLPVLTELTTLKENADAG